MRFVASEVYFSCSWRNRFACINSVVRHTHSQKENPLKRAGLKSTPGRRAVLSVLGKVKSAASAEEIHSLVGREVCDRATIYRILDSLDEAGLLQCMIVKGKKLYLPEEPSHHHHHVICRRCNAAVCLEECVVAPLEKMALDLGFHDIRHSLQLTGLCSGCHGTSKSPPSSKPQKRK